MNADTLKLLLAGEYICPVRYEKDYLVLQDEAERTEVNTWLSALGMRLARLGEEGAFYVAYNNIGAKEITQVKNEFLKFRDEYGRAVLLLDFIRQTDTSAVQLSPGEYILLYQLEAALDSSTMVEAQLKSLVGIISNAAHRNSNHENLRRLMEHLAKDGYVVLADKDTGAYRVTGKIEQLYSVLQFLDENKVIPDTEVNDREEIVDDLVDQANAAGEPSA